MIIGLVEGVKLLFHILAADQLDSVKNEVERQKNTIANLERRLAQQVIFLFVFLSAHEFFFTSTQCLFI